MATSRAAFIGAAAALAPAALATEHGLPPYTPELGEKLWDEAERQAKGAAGGQSHACGFGTWGDSGQLNQWDQGFSPCWPSTLNMAATWDEELMARWSVELAREFGEANRGQLGPGIDIARFAWNGRLGEYMSGEDPYLGSKMIASQVTAYRKVDNPAVQTVKHFIPNTIEKDRNGMTEIVDERTLFEVYYPPFQAAVDAGVSAVMCSYNLVQCTSGKCKGERAYACANDDILNKHLKDSMGFKGIVISDWDATSCQAEAKGSGGCQPGGYIENDYAADAGLDLEMPSCNSFAGGVTKRAHEKEARLRWAYLVQGRDISGSPLPAAQLKNLTGRRLATDDEDQHFCCWWPTTGDCDACTSRDALTDKDKCKGTGRWCKGNPLAVPTPPPLPALPAAPAVPAAPAAPVAPAAAQNQDWQSGIYKDNPFGNAAWTPAGAAAGKAVQKHVDLYGKKVELCKHVGKDNYKEPCKLDLAARVIAESTVVLKNEGGVLPLTKDTKVALVGEEACTTNPTATAGGSGWNGMACNQVPKINVKDGISGLGDDFPKLSCSGGEDDADVVVIVVAPEKASEGRDRSTLQLFPKDVELIKKHAADGKKVVVAMDAPGPMLTSPWDEHVAAIVVSWLPGQQNGRGIAMALYGETYEASGRLPFTFPKCKTKECTKDDELDSVQFGDQIKNKKDRIYTEKALIGYRWYHAKKIEVSYPFGFGLFAYGTAEVKYSSISSTALGPNMKITVTAQHSGPRAGQDVPQLYLSFPDSIPGDASSKPEWQLKGFTKVLLKPNEPKVLTFDLTQRDLSYWDDAEGKSLWVCATGTFKVCVGADAVAAINPQKGACTTFMNNCPPQVGAGISMIAKKSDDTMPEMEAPASSAILSSSSGLAALAAAMALVASAVMFFVRRGASAGARWTRLHSAEGHVEMRLEDTRLLVLEEQRAEREAAEAAAQAPSA